MFDWNGIVLKTAPAALALAAFVAAATWTGQSGRAWAQAAAPRELVRETGRVHRDWKEACEVEGPGKEICFIYQQVQLNGRSAANVTVGFKAKAKQPVAVINMPLGAILLPDGLRIETDKGVDGWAPFLFCDQRGCHVETEIAPDLLRAMQSGSAAWLVVRDLRGEALRLEFSLLGFTAGLKSLGG